ncbi:MAG: hypothetical protein ACJ72D_30825 [Marmoricola sp.]
MKRPGTRAAPLAFAVLALAAAGAGTVVRQHEADDRAAVPPRGRNAGASTTTPSATPSTRTAVVTVRAGATSGRVRLVLHTDQVPLTVRVTLDPAAGPDLTRRVTLDSRSSEVRFAHVPTGATAWEVRTAGVTARRGRVWVPRSDAAVHAPTSAPAAPAPTTAGGSPVAPAAPAPPTRKPTVRPPATGPTAPYDPDDH